MKKIIILIVLSLITGCFGRKAEAPPKSFDELFLSHTVKYSGETMAGIAKWYTGKADNWRLIAAANPEIKPERIRIKDIIVIPREIVLKSDPMPKPELKGGQKIEQSEKVLELENTSPSATGSKEETLPLTTTDGGVSDAPIAAANTNSELPINLPELPQELVVEVTPDPNFGKPRPPDVVSEDQDRLRSRDDLIQEILSKQ